MPESSPHNHIVTEAVTKAVQGTVNEAVSPIPSPVPPPVLSLIAPSDLLLAPPLTKAQFDAAVAFHGHHCPGLSFGLRAAAYAVQLFGRATDEDIVTLTETDMCAVDAIQSLVGCTFGKGNLIHRPYGKVAFTFYRRRDNHAVRLVQNPLFRERHYPTGLPEAKARQHFMQTILTAPFAELFHEGPAREPLPAKARIEPTLLCAQCGEGVMESRAILQREQGGQGGQGGRVLCIPCAKKRS